MTKQQSKKRDPIKDAPLRDPGQSLREQLDDVYNDKIMSYAVIAAVALVLAALEWYSWFLKLPHQPLLITFCAGVVIIYAITRVARLRKQAENMRLGLKGEQYTGQFLQAELIPLGYSVFHDICFDDFNIDHAAIGPGGVFAIETKTRSKPTGRDANVTYDGEGVRVDGRGPDHRPVVQAKAEAKSLQELLTKYTGVETSVRPVVLFTGWYVEKQPSGVDVWVLNEKAFVKFVENEGEKLKPKTQKQLTEGLARYVRDRLGKEST